MSDLFHKDAQLGFIEKCFMTMIAADRHTYQILTKRPHRMAEFSKVFYGLFGFMIPPHIWLGTSIEDNSTTYRINELRKVKGYTRFISFEPLLEKLHEVNLRNIDWAIIGGESGPNYRRVEEEWVWDLIKQCRRQGVKIFFKQWGGARPKSGGREIRGRTFDEFPQVKPLKAAHKRKIKALQTKLKEIKEIQKQNRTIAPVLQAGKIRAKHILV